MPALLESGAAVVRETPLRAEADDARQSPVCSGLHHAELVHVVHHDVAPVAEPEGADYFQTTVCTKINVKSLKAL